MSFPSIERFDMWSISTFFGSMKLKLYAFGALLVSALLTALYFSAKVSGARKLKQKIIARRLEDAKKAQEIDDEVGHLTDDELRERANRWVRGRHD